MNERLREKLLLELAGFDIYPSHDLSMQELHELVGMLPMTKGQAAELRRYGYESEIIPRKQAALLLQKIQRLRQEQNALPALRKQLELLHSRNIAYAEGITRGQAAELIYNLAPEPWQLEYIKRHSLKFSPYRSITYGYCQEIINKRRHGEKEHKLDEKLGSDFE